MNNINKIIQQRESEKERMLLDLVGIANRTKAGQVTHKLEEIKQFQKETNKMIIDEVVRMVEETPIEKAHTYSSENADEYRAYDAGQENFKDILIKELKQ